MSVCAPIKSYFFVCYHSCGTHEHKLQWPSEPDVLRWESGKLRQQMCSPNPSILREKLAVGGSFPPDCMALCCGEDLWQECVSDFPTCFNVGIFSFAQGVEGTQLVSGFL